MVIEFVRTTASLRDPGGFVVVITRPGGLAAQSGVPEAWKYAHKSGLPIAVLPDLQDAIEIYRPSTIYIFSRNREWVDFSSLEIDRASMLVFPSGEQPVGKGLERVTYVGFQEFSRDLGPVQSLSIALYMISKGLRAPQKGVEDAAKPYSDQ
jgi:SpoU rRNA methylase family enzyme